MKVLLDAHTFDFTVVIGGYNSSNTRNLARICSDRVTTYHIAEPSCLRSRDEIRHLPQAGGVAGSAEVSARAWLAPDRPLTVGVTAGASTPDNIVGQVIAKLVEFSG